MARALKTIVSIFLFFTTALHADLLRPFSVSEELRAPLQAMTSFDQGKSLLKQLAERGSLEIRFEELQEPASLFGGLWDGNKRKISVNKKNWPDRISLLKTLAIELHNALREDGINKLWGKAQQGLIDKEQFVREAEKWEYQNLLQARDLLNSGIKIGVIPPEATFHPFNDFESYYMLQQLGKHSQWYALAYDRINPYGKTKPYEGSIGGAILAEADRLSLLNYLYIKNSLGDSAASSWLSSELGLLYASKEEKTEQQLKLDWLAKLFHSKPASTELLALDK